MDENGYTISEPRHKDVEHYLAPGDWHGEPVPEGYISPVGQGQECWYVVVKGWVHGREWVNRGKVIAAETPERAQEAALAWIDGPST